MCNVEKSPLQPTSNLKPQDNCTEKAICRNFIWGTCTKHTKCKFRHELNIVEMKKVLKFCHDYQNRTGCAREDCTYLHATKDEEDLFFEIGKLPQVLAERHAVLAKAAEMSTVETVPQIALFISESYAAQPPPPPPIETAVVTMAPPPPPPPVTTSAQVSTQPSISVIPLQQQLAANIPLLHQLPPPPPPPPVTTTANVVRPLYSGLPLQPSIGTINQTWTSFPPFFDANKPPPKIPQNARIQKKSEQGLSSPTSTNLDPVKKNISTFVPIFDPSKPPPLLPTKNGNVAVKRIHPEVSEAGPRKRKPSDNCEKPGPPCDQCIQYQSRLGNVRMDIEKMSEDEVLQNLKYNKLLKNYKTYKDLASSVIGPDTYTTFEEFIEGSTSVEENKTSQAEISPLSLKNCLKNLVSVLKTSNTTTREEDNLRALAALLRGASSSSTQLTSLDILNAILCSETGQTTEPCSPTHEGIKSNNIGQNIHVNGFKVVANGQKISSSALPNDVNRSQPALSIQPSGDPRLLPAQGPTAAPANAPPPPYPPNVPQPPPNRPYYSQVFAPTPNHCPTFGVSGPVHAAPPPPLTSAPNGNSFFSARYPQYYPRY